MSIPRIFGPQTKATGGKYSQRTLTWIIEKDVNYVTAYMIPNLRVILTHNAMLVLKKRNPQLAFLVNELNKFTDDLNADFRNFEQEMLETKSAQELKSVYRRYAKECHPDKQGNEALFQALNSFYRLLLTHL